MDQAWQTQDEAKQRAIRAELEALSLGDLEVLARTVLVRVLDGQRWWDLEAATGFGEEECRRIVALGDVLREVSVHHDHGREHEACATRGVVVRSWLSGDGRRFKI